MNKIKYKLIISDYDGTLSNKNVPSEEVVKAIREAFTK